MDKKFSFNAEKHLYELDGKPMTGVTTILGVIGGSKTGALIQWASNLACEYIRKHFDAKIHKDKKNWDELIGEAKFAHRKKKEAAGSIGTDIHKCIELWITEKKEPIGLDDLGIKMFNNFKNWALKNEVKFLESELRMYNEELFIAGTADFICEIKGKKYIGDLKTGGVFDRLPMAQAAAYRSMYEKDGKKLDGTVIVNIKKDGSFNEEKDVYMSYDYQTDLNIFLSALTIYRALATFKN